MIEPQMVFQLLKILPLQVVLHLFGNLKFIQQRQQQFLEDLEIFINQQIEEILGQI